ncbi:unnamed protein product [Effrenium voratum]|nr:unnamed protein product [Effrenium voratum]
MGSKHGPRAGNECIYWNRLIAKKSWRSALALCQSLASSEVRLDVVSFNSCLSGSPWQRAQCVCGALQKQSLRSSAVTWGACATCVAQGAQWRRTLCVRAHMAEVAGPVSNVVVLNANLSALRSAWDKALLLLNAKSAASADVTDVVSFNSGLRAAWERWEVALQVLGAMGSHCLQRNAVTQNTVSACLDWRRALQFLQRDHVGYNTCMSSAEGWRLVAELLREMRTVRLSSSDVTYTSAITSLEKAGLWQSALDLATGCLSTEVGNAAINVFQKSGEWRHALWLHGAMKGSGLERDVVTLGSSITACECVAKWRRALLLYAELDPARLRCNSFTLAAAAASAASASGWARGLAELQAAARRLVWPNAVPRRAVVAGCAGARRWREALNLGGKERNVHERNVVLGALQWSQWRQVLALLSRAGERDVTTCEAAMKVGSKVPLSFLEEVSPAG